MVPKEVSTLNEFLEYKYIHFIIKKLGDKNEIVCPFLKKEICGKMES